MNEVSRTRVTDEKIEENELLSYTCRVIGNCSEMVGFKDKKKPR